MIKYSTISIEVLRKGKSWVSFLNVSRVAARLMSASRAFHRRGAAELKACSPTWRQVRGTNSSEFVAERRLVWRWIVEAGCSMSEMYAGAVLFNDWYRSMHILNSIRAATGSQCKLISESISAVVTCPSVCMSPETHTCWALADWYTCWALADWLHEQLERWCASQSVPDVLIAAGGGLLHWPCRPH